MVSPWLSRSGSRLAGSVRNAPWGGLPDFVPPELATLVSRPPAGDQWVHEIKFDGYRTAGRIVNGKVRMLTRKGLDWTDKFAPIAVVLAGPKVRSAYIDGEIVVVDDGGVTDFAGLQEALSDGAANQLVYHAFDLLHLDGPDLTALRLVDRKAALRRLLSGSGLDDWVRYSAHVTGQESEFFETACRADLEGIVSKRADAPYRPGRGNDWVKVKCVRRQEFVIGGWLPSGDAGRDLRSILVGYYDQGRLHYAGKVGAGFSDKSGRDLIARLRKLERKDVPFIEVPREDRKGARWVDPKIVAEVAFTTWTRDGALRHPLFKGLREDKDPRDVTIERPADRPG